LVKEIILNYNITNHILVPKHVIISKDEVKELIETYHCNIESLPHISNIDPMVKKLQAQPGEVIKITRKSSTAGMSTYYRLVVVV
jgi:DNA-directed RNA polymerase subunit H